MNRQNICNRIDGKNDKITPFIDENTQIIEAFFTDFEIQDCRENLWQLLKSTFHREHSSLTDIEAINLATFYERILNVIAAVHNLHGNTSLKESAFEDRQK